MHDLKQPRRRRRRRTGWRRCKADVNIHAFISVASPKWVQVISVPTASNTGSIQNWQSLVGLGQSRRSRRKQQLHDVLRVRYHRHYYLQKQMFESCLLLFTKLSNTLQDSVGCRQFFMFCGEIRPVWSPHHETYLSMSVFVSHSASEEARHVVCMLTQHGLQMYTEQAHVR